MADLDFTYAADPRRFGVAVRESPAEHPLHVHPPGPIETVRTDRHRAHDITVHTNCLIEIGDAHGFPWLVKDTYGVSARYTYDSLDVAE